MSETPAIERSEAASRAAGEAPPKRARHILRHFTFGLGPNEALTAWLAIFTGVLAMETAVSVYVLWRTDSTLHGTLIARNRAWITPSIDLVPSSIGEDRPVEVRVKYTNYGNEPANRVSIVNALKFLPSRFDRNWLAHGNPLDIDGCHGELGPPYRMLPHNEDFPLTVSTDKLSKEQFAELKSGVKTVYISGCIRYRTLAEDVWTRYCRYFKNEDGTGLTLAYTQDPLPMEPCSEGNSAN